MSLAIVYSRAPNIATSAEITVEVHLANGLPGFSIVGLADTEVRESRERVRAALQYCRFDFPARRITVNLAPADLPKESGRFDLPIALGILVASGQLPDKALRGAVFAGELSLTGALQPIRGAFAVACGVAEQARCAVIARGNASARAALTASATLLHLDSAASPPALTQQTRLPRLYLPIGNAIDASRVPGVDVYGVPDLPALCTHLRNPDAHDWEPTRAPEEVLDHSDVDMGDVIGQRSAKRALEVAAAGGHHVLMIGPPGAGKSMLAARLPGILPPMSDAEALSSAALLSRNETQFSVGRWRQRPFRTPHHSSSPAALVGGGNPPRPGEVSLAHHGVLFLDELPEFERRTLEMLREPLETGAITISRSGCHAEFPAACQLIAAMNPCPCGWAGDPGGRCRCSPDMAKRYRAKLSGPLLDRIDIQLELAALTPRELLAGRAAREVNGSEASESSSVVRTRVAQARARQIQRQGKANAALNATEIARYCPLDKPMRDLLERAMERYRWSARCHAKVLKVALTIADLDESGAPPNATHIAEAIQYRREI